MGRLIANVSFFIFLPAAFLTIGIPSVRRMVFYLPQTLDSLLANSSPEQRSNVTVLIFLADDSVVYNELVRSELRRNYSQHLESGFFRIIQAQKHYYPSLADLPQNYNDSAVRTRWRSKQVADFALMMAYAHNISEYYLQLEDDVECAPDYIGAIEQVLYSIRGSSWFILDFSSVGMVGRLMRSADLRRVSHFLLLFYEQQPVDWLLAVFIRAMSQNKRLAAKKPVFQHIGNISSLDGKIQPRRNMLFDKMATTKHNWKPVIDAQFKQTNDQDGSVLSLLKNPAAKSVTSNMLFYSSAYGVEGFYRKQHVFWAIFPKRNDFIYITFERSHNLSSIDITTGKPDAALDYVRGAELRAGFKRRDADAKCKHIKTLLGTFHDGLLHLNSSQLEPHRNIACLALVITTRHYKWVVFNTIAIRTRSNHTRTP